MAAKGKQKTTKLAESKTILGRKYNIAKKENIVSTTNGGSMTKESKFVMESFINVVDDLEQVDYNKYNNIVNDIDSIAVANILSLVPSGLRAAIKAPGSIAIFNEGHHAPFWVVADKTSILADPKAYIFESKEQEAHLHSAAISAMAYTIRQDLDNMHTAGDPEGVSIPVSELSASTTEYTAKMTATAIP